MCGRVSVPPSYPMTAGAVWFQPEHIGGYAHRVSRVRRQEGPGLISAYAANTKGLELQVAAGGTLIPLPDAQLLSPEITVSPDNTVFTVNESGNYLITYHVNITAALKMGTRLMIDNSSAEDSVIAPVASISSFENRIQRMLSAGALISLQMYTDTVGGATLMGNGVGASLSIIRLSD